jgi:hypothetical protein
MKRLIITAGAVLLVAVPASVGLVGNASFAQSVPAGVPSHAVVVDDNGGQSRHLQVGDDNGGLRKHAKVGDDNGGVRGGDDGPRHS